MTLIANVAAPECSEQASITAVITLHVFRHIAAEESAAGHAESALAWCRLLEDNHKRALGLLGIAEGLLGGVREHNRVARWASP